MLQIFNYGFKNKAEGIVDIFIDGEIVDAPTQEFLKNFWGDETSISFRSFRNQINDLNPKIINLYVNSPGGHVGDAMAMHDYLNELESKNVIINRIGIGIVASAATYLLLGANSVMTKNSMLMIHNVQMVAYGDITQCENQVKAGRKYNNLIRDFYVNVTGKSSETISAWMNKEMWFTAQEAKDNGFITNISEPTNFKNSIDPNKWPYQNKEILKVYNSLTIKKSEMDISKITEAIENGFKKFFNANKENKIPESASKDFANEIVNSFKPFILTEEKVTELVNKAIEEATKDDIKTLSETFVNKTEMENLQKEIVNSLGGKTSAAETQQRIARPKNRFSGKIFYNESK